MKNSELYAWLPFAKPITEKKKPKAIAKVSKSNKNTARKLNAETIWAVYKRDWFKCIIKWCTERNIDIPHHIFYWIEAEYWEDRNDINKLVTLCQWHHYQIHHWEWGKVINNECKEYINNIYNVRTRI